MTNPLNLQIPILIKQVLQCGDASMRQYDRLFEETRNSRRTIADAVYVLEKAAGFGEHDRAQIRIVSLGPPSGDVTGLVGIFFDASDPEKGFVVWLPTSAYFRAIRHGSSQRDRFEIWRLDGAVVDAAPDVLLADGTKLRAVEVEPTHLPYKPTELDWRIVHRTLEHIKAKHCYRSLRDGVPSDLQHFVPDTRFLDCSKLSGLKLPSLKRIARAIGRKDWTLRNLSHQKIANALRTFGIRLPTARPRVTSAPR
jgi:hypothetical protein